MLSLAAGLQTVRITGKARTLARALIAGHVLPQSSLDDALHLATATTEGCQRLLSWNYAHLVNHRRQDLYRAVARSLDYHPVEAVTPLETGGESE